MELAEMALPEVLLQGVEYRGRWVPVPLSNTASALGASRKQPS
jgi:hypothetical protein